MGDMSDTTFYGYAALLLVSGVLLTILAIAGFGQSKGARIVDALFAVAFLGYGAYLLLFFDGGRVIISYYALIVPVLAVYYVVKSRKARREEAAAAAAQPQAAVDPVQQA